MAQRGARVKMLAPGLAAELTCGTDFPTKQRLAVDRLRRAILSGRLPPGAWLRQEHLSTLTGLSRTPIREALVQLESEGLVRQHAHRGALVAPLSAEEFQDIYLVRGQLEPLAARLSAEVAAEVEIAAMRARLQRMAAVLDDYSAFLLEEDELRRVQYAPCRRTTLCNLVLALRERATRYLALYSSVDGHTRAKLEMDSQLLAAYVRHDGAAAEQLTAAALAATSAALLPRLNELRS